MDAIARAIDLAARNPLQAEVDVTAGFCGAESGGKFLRRPPSESEDLVVGPARIRPVRRRHERRDVPERLECGSQADQIGLGPTGRGMPAPDKADLHPG